MGDPLKKVLPGQDISIPAEAYNSFVDAANAHRGSRSISASSSSLLSRQSGVIKVKNTTASAIDRFKPVGLSGMVITPTDSLQNFQNTPVFTGVAPGSSTYLGKFAVLLEPLAADAIGDAVVSGIVVSQISVGHTAHDRVDVSLAGGASLVSAFYGSGEILYAESGTGTKWALVRVGPWVAPQVKAIASASIAAGSSGNVAIQRAGSATETVTAYLNWMAGTTGVNTDDELMIQYLRDEAKWVILGAECSA